LTNLQFSPAAHAQAARELCALADALGHGRLLALGGGGYDRGNLARTWVGVLEALLEQ
jgi:acetoin utilization protein AcuC